MGFGFPTGMRLINVIDTRPAPWFWAINGAAGVLAASIAVAVNIAFSINVSIWIAAGYYLLVGMAAVGLANAATRKQTSAPLRPTKPAGPRVCRVGSFDTASRTYVGERFSSVMGSLIVKFAMPLLRE